VNCFEHQGIEAVAVCPVCGKGLCQQCDANSAFGHSCRGEHQSLLASLQLKGYRRTQQLEQEAKSARMRLRLQGALAVLLVIAGVVFWFCEIRPLVIAAGLLLVTDIILFLQGYLVYGAYREYLSTMRLGLDVSGKTVAVRKAER
jgi:hypothetical protein